METERRMNRKHNIRKKFQGTKKSPELNTTIQKSKNPARNARKYRFLPKCQTKTVEVRILAVNLNERPGGQLEAAVAARLMEQVRRDPSARAGSIRLTAKHSLGNYFRPRTWSACGVGAGDLVEFMESLTDRDLFLPRMGKPVPVPVCPLGELGQRGVYSLDITGWNKERDGTTTARGPFDLAPLTPAPAFPILWGHDHKRETRMIVSPDRQCIPKEGCRERGGKMWENHASRLHVNINFQLNSQPLAACLTEKNPWEEGPGRTLLQERSGKSLLFCGQTQRWA